MWVKTSQASTGYQTPVNLRPDSRAIENPQPEDKKIPALFHKLVWQVDKGNGLTAASHTQISRKIDFKVNRRKDWKKDGNA